MSKNNLGALVTSLFFLVGVFIFGLNFVSPKSVIAAISDPIVIEEPLPSTSSSPYACPSIPPGTVCSYPPPPAGCQYEPGPCYNQANQCGLVLLCQPTTPTPTPAPSYSPFPSPPMCSYPPPPAGCQYVPGPDYDPNTGCGMTLLCSSPAPSSTPSPSSTASPYPTSSPAPRTSCQDADINLNSEIDLDDRAILYASLFMTFPTSSPTLLTMCSYPPPPAGCQYVPGPDYDPNTGCGMTLLCSSPAPTPPPLPSMRADINRDGKVDMLDYSFFAREFGQGGRVCPAN